MNIRFGTLTPAQQGKYELLGLPKNTTITRYTTDILPARTNMEMYRIIDWHRDEKLPARLVKASTKEALETVITEAVERFQQILALPGRMPIEQAGSTAVDIWFHLRNKTDLTVSDAVFDRVIDLMKTVKAKAEDLAGGSK